LNRRIEHLTASIERGVREVISRGFHDPRISGLITVTGVKVTPDLVRATIHVSVFPAEKQILTLHGLQDAARFIRREVGDLVSTRKLPEFVFEIDESLKKEAAILADLARVRDDLAAKGITVTPVDPTRPPPQDSDEVDDVDDADDEAEDEAHASDEVLGDRDHAARDAGDDPANDQVVNPWARGRSSRPEGEKHQKNPDHGPEGSAP
jgi:ribosome-binding factor A